MIKPSLSSLNLENNFSNFKLDGSTRDYFSNPTKFQQSLNQRTKILINEKQSNFEILLSKMSRTINRNKMSNINLNQAKTGVISLMAKFRKKNILSTPNNKIKKTAKLNNYNKNKLNDMRIELKRTGYNESLRPIERKDLYFKPFNDWRFKRAERNKPLMKSKEKVHNRNIESRKSMPLFLPLIFNDIKELKKGYEPCKFENIVHKKISTGNLDNFKSIFEGVTRRNSTNTCSSFKNSLNSFDYNLSDNIKMHSSKKFKYLPFQLKRGSTIVFNKLHSGMPI